MRKQEGLTQAQLAEKVGLSDNFVGLIERGIGHPTLEKLDQIARTLKVPIKELFMEKGGGLSKGQAIKEIVTFLSKREDDDARFVLSLCKIMRSYRPEKN